MKTQYRYWAILALAAVTFWSCERDTDGFDGPNLDDLFGDFKVLTELESSSSTVDFSNGGSVHFTASASIATDWVLEITGQQSGAVKRITGKTRDLDISNSLWDGSTTDFPMFRAEDCVARLYYVGYTDTMTVDLSVTGVKQNDGFLLSDFENGIDPNWNVFAQTGANMSFFTADSGSPQQSSYYDMGGEVTWDWLIGLVDIPASAYGAPTFPLSTDGESVYFNSLVNIPAGIQNAILLVQFREDDNEDGSYTDGSEDLWSIELRPADFGSGWKLFSVQYNNLATLVNGEPSNPIGNGIYEPHKLNQVSFLMLADPSSGYSQTLIDYIIFTENAPLNP